MNDEVGGVVLIVYRAAVFPRPVFLVSRGFSLGFIVTLGCLFLALSSIRASQPCRRVFFSDSNLHSGYFFRVQNVSPHSSSAISNSVVCDFWEGSACQSASELEGNQCMMDQLVLG